MSDAQFMPTADEELYIPESVIESSATQEELDIWIKAEVERRGLIRFWYVIPLKFRTESPASDVSDGSHALVAGSLATIGASSTMCGTRDLATEDPPATSRRRVITRAVTVGGSVAALLLLGKKQTAAQSSCFYCGNYCYFSEFYGQYVLDCYYRRSGANCWDCCGLRYQGYGCNICYTGAVNSFTCNPL